jgi:peptide deformylase
MAARIRTYGDPILSRRTNEVQLFDESLAGLVDSMFDAMRAKAAVGLAANQIGVDARVFVYQVNGTSGVVINPEIGNLEGTASFEEGCLSLPGIRATLERPASLVVLGVDVNGAEICFDADGFLARVIQHEMDHLDGVLILDRLAPGERADALVRWRNLQAARSN